MRSDIAVVGAGPAGSLAAAALARAGARVVLIDGSHPREKPCGGGLTSRALSLLAPFASTTAVPHVTITHARLLDGGRRPAVTVPLTTSDALEVFSRRELDAALFDAAAAAGATVVRGRVRAFTPGTPHALDISDGTRIEAGFVIGADGANSLIRRRSAAAFTRHQLSIATGVYAHGVSSSEIVLEMVDAPPGYIWSFPRPDHLAIGICAQANDTTVGALRSTLMEWIVSTGIADGARLEPYAWPIPSLASSDFMTLPLGGNGWLTIGDAAGLVDPITREGIYFALQSALFAADALQGERDSAVRRYTSRVREEISTELAMAAVLKEGFFRPRFTGLMFDALESSAKVRAVMADLVAGVQPYRTLKRRLLGTFELGLAWKWFRSAQRVAS